jgi:hypothetical protein
MVKNGYDYIYHGHNHSFGTWQDEFIDMKWPFREGEWFRLDVYRNGGCGHAFHSWNNGGTYSGAHSRMQIEYAGPL